MKYESKFQGLASNIIFRKRVFKNMLFAIFLLLISLGLGILGYHYFADLIWIDALHNASMILSGMGPVAEIKSDIGKIFSSIYAIFSGVAFITNIGLLFAPIVHRFYHKFHINE
ncbi:MAG: hypothetical protein IPP08_05580 [Chlorobiota bacterium]|nr:hypothetical protein [Chlorobiota bacterium]QQS67635.1 MAG: hypothetical protein IPP08_05580 [Chlorobiota bacterium]